MHQCLWVAGKTGRLMNYAAAACLCQAGAGRGLAGGAVIQRFPELPRRRRGGGVWGSDVAAERASPNRILDEHPCSALFLRVCQERPRGLREPRGPHPGASAAPAYRARARETGEGGEGWGRPPRRSPGLGIPGGGAGGAGSLCSVWGNCGWKLQWGGGEYVETRGSI